MNVPHSNLGADPQGKTLPTAIRPPHGIEEIFKLKRTSLLSILAMLAAALLPLAALSQVAPSHKSSNAEGADTYKYDAYVGGGYTSLNQVNGSRYGLIGAELAVTRYWGKHLGFIADGAAYVHPVSSPGRGERHSNPDGRCGSLRTRL